RVEEDWKVEVNIPDPDNQAPQIITSVSPNGSVVGLHAVFELNHKTMPDYSAGGMQLQGWWDEEVSSYHTSSHTELLNREDETITYTVAMSVADGQMKFEIKNGNSSTWGTFGKGHFYLSMPTDMTSLDSYDSSTSLTNSRVGFASYRVGKFSRVAVRKYSA